jgi:hypothetical protein
MYESIFLPKLKENKKNKLFFVEKRINKEHITSVILIIIFALFGFGGTK